MAYTPSTKTADVLKRRTKLKDDSWIKRNADQEEIDPNYGKVVLNPLKPWEGISSQTKAEDASQTSKAGSNSPVSKSTMGVTNATTKDETVKSGTYKPAVPAKSATALSPTKSTFTERVFSDAKSTNKVSFPRVTSPQAKTFPKDVTSNDEHKTVLSVDATASKEETKLKAPESTPAVPTSTSVNGFSRLNSVEKAPSTQKTEVQQQPPPTVTPSRNGVTTTSRAEKTSATKVSESQLLPSPTAPTLKSSVTTLNSVDKPPVSTVIKSQPPMDKPSFTETSTPAVSQPACSSPSKNPADNTLDDLAETLLSTNNHSVKSSPAVSKSASTLSPAPSQTLKSSPEKTTNGSLKDGYSYSVITSPTKTAKPSTPLTPTADRYRFEDTLVLSPARTQSVYTTPTKAEPGKTPCSFCRKPIVENSRMILKELDIYSHLSCFKCATCHRILGNMEAGGSLWVHRDTVNCEDCFENTRGLWFR
ncbi:mucin-2 isoform X1 [Denticeps clupeoides]|uniref:LIM zinc-binding domain-containing protein n=1 Tax=Denticeps clupeoides TaxID=299321 RepID=A0AAY4C099_9TELE|nr:mucin-2-like isoform X1 [Denticeps clupeoides]